MTEFQGIPIDEGLLSKYILIDSIFLALLFTVAIILLCWVVSSLKPTANEKRQSEKADARIRKLREKAASDPRAERELARRLRKKQRSTREKRNNNAILFVAMLCLFALIIWGFFMLVVPKYQDRQYKDYVIYDGGFEVRYGNKHNNWIVLPDNTHLEYSRFGHDEGTYSGTIVYAPRSELVLGIEWE